MKISSISIKNYRNLDGLLIKLSDNCNFIVGENNIGKSNLLNMIRILFSNKSFDYDDFKDPLQSLEILISIKLSEVEIGHFDDLFDVDQNDIININCIQLSPDENIEYKHLETDTFIPSSIVRSINYIHYDSLRSPNLEINFNKGRGVGKFLINLISKYLKDTGAIDNDFINQKNIDLLLDSINLKINKLKSFSDFKINAGAESNLVDLLSGTLIFKDEKNNHLSKSGYGVQFLILIVLSILEKVQSIKERRGGYGIFDSADKKLMSLVIGLDEPEIHLHPYMQRSLIKYLNDVILNNNPDFVELIKDLFDIDGFMGQIIVITHSPNILLNDYKQISRLYKKSGVTCVKSGTDITIDAQSLKHLLMRFLYFKEAFFSRCVVFVEGDSEEGVFRVFADKMSINFDDYGISIIQARGDLGTINALVKLANQFDISSIGIADRDNNPSPAEPVYITSKKDFEEEIIDSLIEHKESVLRDIVKEFNGNSSDRVVVQLGSLNKVAVDKYHVFPTCLTYDLTLSNIPLHDKDNLKAFYLTWFTENKGYLLGRLIGEKMELSDIPDIYKYVIQKSVTKAIS